MNTRRPSLVPTSAIALLGLALGAPNASANPTQLPNPEVKKKRTDNRKPGELSSNFERELNENGSALWFLSDLSRDNGRLGVGDVSPHAVSRHLDAVAALRTLAKRCATRYAPILKRDEQRRRIKTDRAPKPIESCELAAKSEELTKRWLPRAVKAYVKHVEMLLRTEVKDIQATGKASNTILTALNKKTVQTRIAQDVKAFAPSAKALNIKVTPKMFSPWLKAVRHAPKAIEKAGKTRRHPPNGKNESITQAAKRRLNGTVLRFRNIGLVSKTGRTKKNLSGVPMRQVWRGELLAKKEGESFCRLYDFEANAEYRGGGRYQAPVAKLRGRGFQIAACR